MGERKAVQLIYASGALVIAILYMKTFGWVWGFFSERAPGELLVNGTAAVLAVTIAVILYRNERVFTVTNEVAAEIRKVTWPTAKETKMATLVVIVTVFVAAVILGSFDAIWSYLTDLLYK